MPKPPDRFRDLGAFIREQRSTARLSLRRLSELAGISNPYLSQIERGLRRPSAEILQQIAKALRISAETLYVQAGILEPGSGEADLGREILADPFLTEEQKQALVRIYLSFRHENEVVHPEGLHVSGPGSDGPGSDGLDSDSRGLGDLNSVGSTEPPGGASVDRTEGGGPLAASGTARGPSAEKPAKRSKAAG
jgi:transcriptional regulator with XRE-family HTH domain